MSLQRETRLALVVGLTAGLYAAVVLALVPHDMADLLQLLAQYAVSAGSGAVLVALLAVAWLFARDAAASRFRAPAMSVLVSVLQRATTAVTLVRFVTPVAGWALVLWAFGIFKQDILPLSGYRWDPLLADLDQALFAGHEPWLVSHGLLDHPWATLVLDRLYHGWYVPMVAGVYVCALLAGGWHARARYLVAYLLVWIVGATVLAWLMASVGPCYFAEPGGYGDRFDPLMARLQAQEAWLVAHGHGGLGALRLQAMLAANHAAHDLSLGQGISAMPSMHCAFAILFALALWPINRVVSAGAWVYAGLIWIGSFHLGWHYALDGLVALPVVWAIWVVADRFATWLDRQPEPIRVVTT
jgi:hypothetical protein